MMFGRVQSLIIERVVPRQGSLRARLDFDRGYLTWRDSGQWSNDCTRTVNEAELRQVNSLLSAENLFETASETGDEASESHWAVLLNTDDGRFRLRPRDPLDETWRNLVNRIERLARACFFR